MFYRQLRSRIIAPRIATALRIDTRTFQWVKVEAEIIHSVWIGGFLARVDPGTRFEVEYSPVTDKVWLSAHYALKSHAKVLFLFGRGIETTSLTLGTRSGCRIPDVRREHGAYTPYAVSI